MKQRLIILQVAAAPLYWLILAASLWVLLRGHNEPGGGFIGGLVAVSASILWAVAHGSDDATRRLPLRDPVLLAATGVALGALSGVVGLLQGHTFLTHWWVAGPLSTVLLFDIGVYLCVWGALAGYALALLDVDETDTDTNGDTGSDTGGDRNGNQNGRTARGRR